MIVMFKAIVTASVSVLLLTIASAASAKSVKSSCEETAETNYAIAIAIDYENADMVYENTMADCGGWDAPYAAPLSYQDALDEAERIGALGVERFPGTVDGWVPSKY